MIEFRQNTLLELYNEGLPEIIQNHWDEVGVNKEKCPLSVDWQKYSDIEKTGMLWLMGARKDEKLVGYVSFIILPHLHYSTTLHAVNDAIYINSNCRGLGIKLIKEAEKALAKETAQRGYPYIRIIYHTKLHVENTRGTLSRVFEHLGYNAFETTLDKVVESWVQ